MGKKNANILFQSRAHGVSAGLNAGEREASFLSSSVLELPWKEEQVHPRSG